MKELEKIVRPRGSLRIIKPVRSVLTIFLLMLLLAVGTEAYAKAVQLNGPAAEDIQIYLMSISPDNLSILYGTWDYVNGTKYIYHVPIGGGYSKPLTPPLEAEESINGDAVSNDGAGLVFRTVVAEEHYKLYYMSLSNGDCIELNCPQGVGIHEYGMRFTPDKGWVIIDDDRIGLYAIPCNGDEYRRLSDVGECHFITFNADASKIIYRNDPTSTSIGKLNVVSIDHEDSAPLTDYLPGHYLWQEETSHDGRRYVYKTLAGSSSDHSSVYSVSLEDGSAVMLNGPLVENGHVLDFKISPDSQRVVYRADQDTYGFNELYSVPISGGTPVKLNIRDTGLGVVEDFALSSDGANVVYSVVDQQFGDSRIYSVSIAGGASVLLSPEHSDDTLVGWFQVSPKTDMVVYLYHDLSAGSAELYSVPISGGTPVKLTRFEVQRSWVRTFYFTPDGDRVVYRAEHDYNYKELCSVPCTGGMPVKLFSVKGSGLSIGMPYFTTDGKRVVFSATVVRDAWNDLYSATLAPTGLPPYLLLMDQALSTFSRC